MQTNTKAKQQPKGNNWVLTPEIMVLSILLVATLVIGITAVSYTHLTLPTTPYV